MHIVIMYPGHTVLSVVHGVYWRIAVAPNHFRTHWRAGVTVELPSTPCRIAILPAYAVCMLVTGCDVQRAWGKILGIGPLDSGRGDTSVASRDGCWEVTTRPTAVFNAGRICPNTRRLLQRSGRRVGSVDVLYK